MTGNVDHCATLTFILLTFTLTIHQVQGQKRTCDLFSRPHPNGLCGPKLAKAHENLCFLIRQNYPQFFPQIKRSPVLDAELLDDLSFPPLQHFLVSDADFSVGREDIHETPFSLRRHDNRIPSLKTFGVPGGIPVSDNTNTILRVLNKRNRRSRKSLVCECCYRPCSTRVLARYC